MNTAVVIAVLAALVGGCSAEVHEAPAERGRCEPPALTDPACVTEGDSPFWGPGPNTYCIEADGSEWHLYPYMSTRYVRAEGTHHSVGETICEVAPSGRVIEDNGR